MTRAIADISLDELDIVGPQTYADHGYPHEAWARLRRERPVYWHDRNDECRPFWAITKHADIVKISRQPNLLRNAPRLAVFPEGPPTERGPVTRHLLNMDPPDHAVFRKLVSPWFTPRTIQRLVGKVEAITQECLDAVANDGDPNTFDFVEHVSVPIPVATLADLLGVPREDRALILRWTNQLAGSGDPEYAEDDATPRQTANRALTEIYDYFRTMVSERRKSPQEDIVSLIANGSIDGKPVPEFETLSYFFLLVIAGNETTRNAMSGGLHALIEHPGELAQLRANPDLTHSAVEEIVRYTTPVIQFCRTANASVEIRGQKIAAGESLCLFYPSANRDEELFDAPNEFRISRDPNPHIAFGIGEHFCLGASLARLELRVLFRQLAERLEEVAVRGPISRLRSSFLGGIKHLPVELRLSPE